MIAPGWSGGSYPNSFSFFRRFAIARNCTRTENSAAYEQLEVP